MSNYLTCEADLNFPVPNAERLVAHLRTLFDGATPVTTKAIAISIGGDLPAVEAVLRRAEHAGLVRQVHGQGWVPLATR
jgi:hypothetical protein